MRDVDFFLKRYSTGETPMTHLIFFDMPVAELADALLVRAKDMQKKWQLPGEIRKQPVQGELAGMLDLLLPLARGGGSKILVSSTRSGWTAYFQNRYGVGAGDAGQAGYMAGILKTCLLCASFAEDIPKGQPGGAKFVLEDARSGPLRSRSVYAIKESRWEFEEHGERLPFEEVEAYSAKRIKDRLTLDMLERYCRQFGIELFDPDFYAGDGYIIHEQVSPHLTFYPNYPQQA